MSITLKINGFSKFLHPFDEIIAWNFVAFGHNSPSSDSYRDDDRRVT
jgi:hypothetical protein